MGIKKLRHETMSITGHRWHKLPFGTNERDNRCVALVEAINDILIQQFDNGITHVISGMALGFDTLVSEAVIKLRQAKYPHVTLEAALFCPSQSQPWAKEQKKRFDDILQHCVQPPTITSATYIKGCEMKRNKYMIDNSCILLACWNGTPSGTGNTIMYANSIGVPYIQVNPYDL